MFFVYFSVRCYFTRRSTEKSLVDQNSTLSEFLCIASETFGLPRNPHGVYLERLDESWGERVDVDSIKQIRNRNKLFL